MNTLTRSLPVCLVIKMTDVLVSSYQTGAEIDGLTIEALVEVSGR